MKTLIGLISGINQRPAQTGARRYQTSSLLITVLLACAALVGPGVDLSVLAQQGILCPPGSEPNGTLSLTDNGAKGYGTFPTGPAVDTTMSMGVFQINVDPAYAFLFTGGGFATYPGYSPSAGTLTSPILYDYNFTTGNGTTTIGRSAAQVVNPGSSPFPGSVAIGTGVYADTVTAYPASTPFFPFLDAAKNTTEVFTEMDTFTLSCVIAGGSNYCNTQTPNQTPVLNGNTFTTLNMVMAGQFNPNVAALGLPALPGSYGLVQSQANGETSQGYVIPAGTATYDFPANSMFNIFAYVALPQLAGYSPVLQSESDFPAQGMLLYTDQTTPLIVQDVPPDYVNGPGGAYNEAICGFPPSVIYLHGGNVIAPTLYFAQDNIQGGNYVWHKGDAFGSLMLAGHGTFKPCDPESNLVSAVLGTESNAAVPMPIGYVFPPAGNTNFPPHSGLGYNSLQGQNLGGHYIDIANFSSNFYLNGLSLSSLTNTVILPSPGNSTNYTNINTTVSGSFSDDGSIFYSLSGSGSVVIQISNPNGVVNNATTYTMKVTQLSLACTVPSLGFPVYLRQNPGSNSIGSHIVQSSSQGGPIIASFVNVVPEASTDQITWYNTVSNRAFYMELGGAPCGRAGAKLHVVPGPNGSVIVSWSDSHYTLEGSPSLSPTSWTPISGTSPVTLPAPLLPMDRYLKLTCF